MAQVVFKVILIYKGAAAGRSPALFGLHIGNSAVMVHDAVDIIPGAIGGAGGAQLSPGGIIQKNETIDPVVGPACVVIRSHRNRTPRGPRSPPGESNTVY